MIFNNIKRIFKGLQLLKRIILFILRIQRTSSDDVFIDVKRTLQFNCPKKETITQFSASSRECQIYPLVYWLLALKLFENKKSSGRNDVQEFLRTIKKSQDSKTGLFFEPVIDYHEQLSNDYWGARHLTVHCLESLSGCGTQSLYVVTEAYEQGESLLNELKGLTEFTKEHMDGDFDNKIMNVCCCLHYNKDTFVDLKSAVLLEQIQGQLMNLYAKTGFWTLEKHATYSRSRCFQFYYHLLTCFKTSSFIDELNSRGFMIESHTRYICKYILQTQKIFGGYGRLPLTSACEDQDAVYILAMFYKYVDADFQIKIIRSLQRHYKWQIKNLAKDNYFYFFYGQEFTLGHQKMRSSKTEGNIFCTWFRLLTIAYICEITKLDIPIRLSNTFGYEQGLS